ncbi:LOW QUALITY PROTEIN: glycoprotein 3-alpha-L-fucosyltransferase A [Nilaparvata lugens]|uniref:LOW QUALITY PROTEIN: glycoprotein 3-alpha-L-fucosyltransferase A n=1 Tax=Nilaparvata lugens TaxID=108931 RepID=UPI00193E9385|nr:LOW QUALITY PROTEIN: glycoprotein 3-alpha-L-fucosyltransferase A [Nilaparvata lugens]
MPSRGLEDQQDMFKGCPVDRCVSTTDGLNADAIYFEKGFHDPGHQRPANQIWIWYSHESPMNWKRESTKYQSVFNWTVSYRRGSDLVNPYAKWVYYDPGQTEWQGAYRNYAKGKSKQVAWFVSNCYAKNNRLEYAKKLGQYIQVDIYGYCEAQYECRQENWKDCFKMLRTTYKFYLAFENSNCREYITEKFFENSLRHKVIPIVMGAPKEDYLLVAPKNSFIHVEDFDSPADLAAYLHRIDRDDELYNSYFKWRGTGQFMTRTWSYCRLCAMLHDDYPPKTYENINDWFREPDVCINGTWREYRQRKGGLNPL